jgi:hypothetical protein
VLGGQRLAYRTGSQHGDVDAQSLHLAAQRLAERVRERLGGRVGGVVRDRRIARHRTGDQDPARPTFDHTGEDREDEVVHAEHVQLNLCLLLGGIEVGHGTERRRARVGAQDRHVPLGEFGAQRGAGCGVGQIGGAHLDGDAVAFGQPGGQRGQHFLAPCGQDEMVPTSREFGSECLADVLRRAGDDRAGVRGGCGYWHGANRKDQ